jgi:hypothetical protein
MTGVDLATYSLDGVAVGTSMPNSGLDQQGVEIESDDQNLNSLFITLGDYQGEFFCSGNAVSITPNTSPTEIEKTFGEPYWRDSSDGELILFYEYQAGEIELQFEFPDSKSLGYITIAKDGVLSEAEQRQSYGVDKPWPPAA